jgi:hypothetical protein
MYQRQCGYADKPLISNVMSTACLISPSLFFHTLLCLCRTALCPAQICICLLSPHSFLTIMLPLLSFNISLLYTVPLPLFVFLPFSALFVFEYSLSHFFLFMYTVLTMHWLICTVYKYFFPLQKRSPGSSVGRALGF